MELDKGQYKSYGFIRIGIYAVIFVFSAMFWMVIVLSVMPRLLYFLKALPGYYLFSLGLVFILSALTAFWLVNLMLIVPTHIRIHPGGFVASAPFRRGGEVAVHFSEVGTIFELGFGTLVTVHLKSSQRNYRLIIGKDTDGYYNLVDAIKDGLNEFRTAH